MIFVYLLVVNGSFGAENSCQSKLDDELKTALLANEGLFADLYHLSQLKLAASLADDENQKTILGRRISDKADRLEDSLNKEKLEKEIVQAYSFYGKAITREQAKIFLEGEVDELNPSVAAYLLNSIGPSVNEPSKDINLIGLSEKDEANFWLAEEVGESGMVFPSLTKLLHPRQTPKIYLEGDEGDNELGRIEERVDENIKKLISDFKANEQMCGGFVDGQTCARESVKTALNQQVEDMIEVVALSKNGPALVSSNPLQALDRIRSKYGWRARSRDRAPASIAAPVPDEGLNMCGGKEFYPSLANKEIFGFGDFRGGMNAKNEAFKAYKKGGLNGLKAMNKKNSALGGKTGGQFKGANFLSKMKIPAPMFRCEPESPIALPKIGTLLADKTVCCDDEEQTRKLRYFFFNWGGGMSCRAFFGLPYIAEVGAKIGVGFNIFFSGGVEPEQCLEKSCFNGTPTLNFSAALYAEALAGAGSIQGTISWMPYASLQQCILPNTEELPPADFHYQIGRILAIASVRIGWTFSYNSVKPLYENNETRTSHFPIF